MLSPNNPKARLHCLQRSPLTWLVWWLWSIAKSCLSRGGFLQIWQTPPWACSISAYWSLVIPWRWYFLYSAWHLRSDSIFFSLYSGCKSAQCCHAFNEHSLHLDRRYREPSWIRYEKESQGNSCLQLLQLLTPELPYSSTSRLWTLDLQFLQTVSRLIEPFLDLPFT